jgi:response regulator RpfG family c-di-GMP phosphodiesterase
VDYVRDPCKLPPHLTERRRAPRNLLLVDDETNIVSALKRLLRRDSYTIHTASSGQEGLDILAGQQIDVIVSDQRMPGMTGVEFLRQAKQLYPDTTRIVLSGYSELQSVVAAVNEGAVYKFLMKPWDDEQLREHISDAFRRKEMEDENRRLDLELKQANSALSATNRRLEEVLVQQHKRIELDEISLDVAREALDLVPVPVLALDIENVIAYMNAAAVVLFQDGAALLGSDAAHSLPEVAAALASAGAGAGEPGTARIGGQEYRLAVRRMGLASRSRGWIVTLLHQCEPGA